MIDSCNGLKVDNYYIQENGIVRDNESGVFLARLEELFEEVEHLRVQLAGCGVAAMCNTTESMEAQRVQPGDYGYSASYGAVIRAGEREMKLRSQLCTATEALESLISANTQRITTARYISRTALERIKE